MLNVCSTRPFPDQYDGVGTSKGTDNDEKLVEKVMERSAHSLEQSSTRQTACHWQELHHSGILLTTRLTKMKRSRAQQQCKRAELSSTASDRNRAGWMEHLVIGLNKLQVSLVYEGTEQRFDVQKGARKAWLKRCDRQHRATGTEQDEWSYRVRLDILQVSQSEMMDSEQRSTRRVLEGTEQSIDVQIYECDEQHGDSCSTRDLEGDIPRMEWSRL